jgi:hypothetical protein
MTVWICKTPQPENHCRSRSKTFFQNEITKIKSDISRYWTGGHASPTISQYFLSIGHRSIFQDVSPSKGCEFSLSETAEPSSRTSSETSGTIGRLYTLMVEHDENGHSDETAQTHSNGFIIFLLS